MYGRIDILKNCVIGKKHLVYRMRLVTKNVHVVTGSYSTIQSNCRTNRLPRYCCPSHHRYASLFYSWNQSFWIIGFLGHSPNTNTAWCSKQREGRLILSRLAILRIYNYQTSRFYDHHTTFFRLFAFSVIRGLAIAALLWMLDLRNSRRTIFVETGSSRRILSSAVTFAAAVLWFLDTALLHAGDPFQLVLVFGYCSA
jgi:hypothetical protein